METFSMSTNLNKLRAIKKGELFNSSIWSTHQLYEIWRKVSQSLLHHLFHMASLIWKMYSLFVQTQVVWINYILVSIFMVATNKCVPSITRTNTSICNEVLTLSTFGIKNQYEYMLNKDGPIKDLQEDCKFWSLMIC